MGRALALALVLLGGCTRYFGDDGPEPDPVQHRPDAGSVVIVDAFDPKPPPGICPADLSLALDSDMFKTVPLTLDVAGSTLCVRLDTTAMTHPTYFEARTPMEAGPPASFGVTIYDATNQVLAEGYDAPIGWNQTYATATYYVEARAVFYVKVHAWATETPQATQLALSLYQILD